ncbi:Peroxisomal 2,4-Dienoyl-Coa Reductase [Manis pentadactyla]|nr:Peroxisomal 2,4-Dienoyl-Coa Reductase [Manis pentadactyla]
MQKELSSHASLVPNELQPQVEDEHGRKKFNTHSGAPINIKAKGEELFASTGWRALESRKVNTLEKSRNKWGPGAARVGSSAPDPLWETSSSNSGLACHGSEQLLSLPT